METVNGKTYVTELEIIRRRDNMELSELRAITNRVKERQGYVNYESLFEEMGYVRMYGNVWLAPEGTHEQPKVSTKKDINMVAVEIPSSFSILSKHF